MTMHALRLVPRCVAAAFAILLVAGCALKPIEPWVKPYDRERLADPIMQASHNELPPKHRDHI